MIRDNTLNRKRFLIPVFTFNNFLDRINVVPGAIEWKFLHGIFEKDCTGTGNLRRAPKLTAKAMHPGDCKQSVPPALPLFNQPTISAILFYLPQESGATSFMLSCKNGG